MIVYLVVATVLFALYVIAGLILRRHNYKHDLLQSEWIALALIGAAIWPLTVILALIAGAGIGVGELLVRAINVVKSCLH